MSEAYFERDGITLYCGDARDVLPTLEAVDCVITDPVWPNAIPDLVGSDDPAGLFAQVAVHFPRLARRVVVQLGCNSDPRFLAGMPDELPFFRACWLEYALPGYRGRLLYTSDVAYVFGAPPASEPGVRVIPGRMIQHDATKRVTGHPCPRHPAHVKWLCRWFARGTVLDPFCGSGTTLLAAQAAGYPAIGIEINRDYCDLVIERLRQAVLPLY